jgi:CRP-like cAMP-binding protein
MQKRRTVIQCLMVPQEQRSEEDIEMIYNLTKNISIFTKTLNDDDLLHRACCKLMTFEEFSEGQIVFKYGDIGNKFYIVISGLLAVLVPDKNGKGLEAMKEVKVLTQGDYFGELALINNTGRAATVQAKKTSVLAVLRKSDFKKTLEHFAEKKLNEKVSFLRKIPIFSMINSFELQKLSYYFNENKLRKNQFVFREFQLAEHLYFVKSGDFKLIKCEKIADSYKKFPEKDYLASGKPLKSQRSRPEKVIDLQIVIKGQNECLGYDEIIEKDPYYKTSCMCASTTGLLYSIPFTDFKQRVKNTECWKIITEKYSSDKKNYTERIRNLKFVENLKLNFPKSETSRISNSNQHIGIRKHKNIREIFKISEFSHNKIPESSVSQTKTLATESQTVIPSVKTPGFLINSSDLLRCSIKKNFYLFNKY